MSRDNYSQENALIKNQETKYKNFFKVVKYCKAASTAAVSAAATATATEAVTVPSPAAALAACC